MALISNIKSYRKQHLGLAKTGLKSEVVLILSGLNSEVLLYVLKLTNSCKVGTSCIFIIVTVFFS